MRARDGGAATLDERLLAAALSSVGSAVMITEPDGRIVWVNAAFTAMSGYAAEEAIGRTPRLLKSGRHGPERYADLWTTILGGRTWRGEVVERHKEGHHYTVVQTVTPILDERGQATRFVAIHEDVTQLRASQARLQALFDHALDAIALFDGEGRVVDANPALLALTGRSLPELEQMTMVDLIPAAHHEAFAQAWTGFVTDGRAQGTLPIQHRDGTLVWLAYRAVADIVEGVHLLTARDVTAQRRTEAQQRFQAQLLEAVGEAVIATDLDGRVRYTNPAAERLFGWIGDEVLRPSRVRDRPGARRRAGDRAAAGVARGRALVRPGGAWPA